VSSFFDRLQRRVDEVDSLLCVGLDPHLTELETPSAKAAGEFCIRLIAQTAPLAAAFKANSAYFERFGPVGMAVLREVIAAVPDEIPTILDAKRGDIATSAEAYAAAAFEQMGADAVTVNPYLGTDSLVPFVGYQDRGVFVLCRTSNPGATDLQDLLVAGVPLHQAVARLALAAGANLGLVVGATHPAELAQIRAIAPLAWILAPGVGAQGADLEASVAAGLRRDGSGLLINVSRGIAAAPDPGRAAAELVEQIRAARKMHKTAGSPPPWSGLADRLLQAGCVRFGSFTLRSGVTSPIYLDLRRLTAHPRLLAEAAAAYLPILDQLSFDRLAGLPHAGLPIVTAISLQSGRPFIYPRRESKIYGTRAEIEGDYHAGETVVVIDDLATTGASKTEAIEKLTAAGMRVTDVVVLIDRGQAAEALQANRIRLHAVVTLGELLDHWEATAKVPADWLREAREFLARES